MELYSETLTLDPSSHQKHLKIPLELDRPYDELKITFGYSPKIVPEAVAIKRIEELLSDYFRPEDSPVEASGFLPLVNLITVSLSYNGHYLGCHHNKKTPQEIVISEKGSSAGFIPQAVCQGQWEIQLDMHCLLSPTCVVELRVVGGDRA